MQFLHRRRRRRRRRSDAIVFLSSDSFQRNILSNKFYFPINWISEINSEWNTKKRTKKMEEDK